VELEWDPAKNRANFLKHSLDFEDAELVLEGPCVTFTGRRFDYGEERLITFGALDGRTVVIAHLRRDSSTRIISMKGEPA
jgi:uncharacterized DUF497 family protein